MALVGERTWHASWWEWNGLIVTAYVVILFAAHHQWQEERFHSLYRATTRERSQEVSVLFADLARVASAAAGHQYRRGAGSRDGRRG